LSAHYCYASVHFPCSPLCNHSGPTTLFLHPRQPYVPPLYSIRLFATMLNKQIVPWNVVSWTQRRVCPNPGSIWACECFRGDSEGGCRDTTYLASKLNSSACVNEDMCRDIRQHIPHSVRKVAATVYSALRLTVYSIWDIYRTCCRTALASTVPVFLYGIHHWIVCRR
jgi:hypothetical protein